MQKIAVIGISATGKSRLAKKIASKTKIPLIHMDQLWWNPDWQESSESNVKQVLLKKLKQDAWIIEGYIEPLGVERLQQADAVIYLDYSGLTSLWGGLQRWFRHRKYKRPEMPEGCLDRFNFSYLKTMFKRAERGEIEAVIKASGVEVVRLKSRAETNNYLVKNF